MESGTIMKYGSYLILAIVGFSLFAALYPEAATAGDGMNASNICADEGCFYNASRNTVCTTSNTTASDSGACLGGGDVGVPLSTLFAGGGVVFLIISAAILMMYIKRK